MIFDMKIVIEIPLLPVIFRLSMAIYFFWKRKDLRTCLIPAELCYSNYIFLDRLVKNNAHWKFLPQPDALIYYFIYLVNSASAYSF